MAIAWHWTANTLRDGRPIPPIGEWLVHEGPIEMCSSGLHASLGLAESMLRAPGWYLHRVECRGIEDRDEFQLVCRMRKIIASADMSLVLPDYLSQAGRKYQAADVSLAIARGKHSLAMDRAYISFPEISPTLLLLYWNMLTGRNDLA